MHLQRHMCPLRPNVEWWSSLMGLIHRDCKQGWTTRRHFLQHSHGYSGYKIMPTHILTRTHTHTHTHTHTLHIQHTCTPFPLGHFLAVITLAIITTNGTSNTDMFVREGGKNSTLSLTVILSASSSLCSPFDFPLCAYCFILKPCFRPLRLSWPLMSFLTSRCDCKNKLPRCPWMCVCFGKVVRKLSLWVICSQSLIRGCCDF